MPAVGEVGTSEKELKLPDLSLIAPLPAETFVVFVLGGPGAGKGTQCANLVRDYSFVHLSAGDLLRLERQREGSDYGELINHYIKEGLIVPMEITIALLYQAMKSSPNNRFLIDGFPRQMDQAEKFEETVCKSQFVLFYDCPEEEMTKRLLERGKTSGRVDDNLESIKKRFETFRKTSYPVIESYQKENKVETVSSLDTIDSVYAKTRETIDKRLAMAVTPALPKEEAPVKLVDAATSPTSPSAKKSSSPSVLKKLQFWKKEDKLHA